MATEASALPIDSLINTGKSTPSATNSSTAGSNSASQLGANEFLNLLTTQLKNQNPLSPMDDTQSVAELAQFSALQATTTLSNNFTSFESNSALSQAAGMLGQTVTVATTDAAGNASTIAGTVQAVQMVNGTPQLTLADSSGKTIAGSNGTPLQFTTSQIVGITK